MSRLRLRCGEPVEKTLAEVYKMGIGYDEGQMDSEDEANVECVLVYHDSLWIEKRRDGTYWTVVCNDDMASVNLLQVEDFLFDGWAKFEVPLNPDTEG